VPSERDLTCTERHLADPASLTALQARLLGARTVESVAEVFKLLGDPTRVRMVDALTHGERCVCDLATLLGLSESAVSHQLRLLRTARLVRVRRTGRLAYYSLDDHHVVGLLHDTRKHVEEAQEPASEDVSRRTSGAALVGPGKGE
jgi:ArsR family transcriptional regulator, lead/cadmium/zinc/bismuth-responsive transcriptional repressor